MAALAVDGWSDSRLTAARAYSLTVEHVAGLLEACNLGIVLGENL